MARPQPYRAAEIANRSMTIMTRLKKSSSPSRWLMGLPPTSPRFKFMHAYSGNVSGSSAVPRRPPRQPSSPSTRSRSLELLDQQEQERKMSVSSAIVQRPPLPRPRPRSRSLDGLLDEDVKGGAEESCEKQNKMQREKSRSLTKEEDKTISISKEKPSIEGIEPKDEPRPVPRMKSKTSDAIEFQSDLENARTSLNKSENDKETLSMHPPKPSRHSSLEEQSSTSSSKHFGNQEHQVEQEQRIKETIQERLMMQRNNEKDDYNDDKSTILLKASRSCGAGLDSDGSISSNEYGGSRAAKSPGSLLSLPAGAEPKRKRNFMDKCVNKVRSFIKK